MFVELVNVSKGLIRFSIIMDKREIKSVRNAFPPLRSKSASQLSGGLENLHCRYEFHRHSEVPGITMDTRNKNKNETNEMDML
jgi:hypothetical protein